MVRERATSNRHLFWFSLECLCATSTGDGHELTDCVRIHGAGAWDMFHAGHVAILKQAREFGDYLIAGVHSDEVVNAQRGLNMPIMNLNERVLSVLGCAYVNDVLIDAPLKMTRFVNTASCTYHTMFNITKRKLEKRRIAYCATCPAKRECGREIRSSCGHFGQHALHCALLFAGR